MRASRLWILMGLTLWMASLGGCLMPGALPVEQRLPQWDAVSPRSWRPAATEDLVGSFEFTVRLDGGIDPTMVTIPADYLESLPDDTPVKIEVGAIGFGDNATFSEETGFCVNEVDGCEEE